MNLEKIFVPLSSFTMEAWSDREYEIRDVFSGNDISVFLTFGEKETVLSYQHISPLSYRELTKERRGLVDNSVAIINTLSPRGQWFFEELEKGSPEEEAVVFLMYKATWPNTYPEDELGSEIFNVLITLGELSGFVHMFMHADSR